jgi:hypothetical protein
MNPKYPVYIISKGRWESRLTSKALDAMNVPYSIVIEPQEYEQYSSVIDPSKILVLPFSNLGQGSIPARNWVWEHSIKLGSDRHWILDDNIRCFRRFFKNERIRVKDGVIFKAAEDFIDRYENVPMAGFNYTFLANTSLTNYINKPFLLNTRIYSCILLSNKISHRWRGRYNEDTDLSLRILKDGFCTILFYSFLCDKQNTMTMKGGNTESLYKQDSNFDGRLEMARSLQRQHPDVTKITYKWGRWQHSVDYRPFKRNKLIKRPDFKIPDDPEYGMKLVNMAAQ